MGSLRESIADDYKEYQRDCKRKGIEPKSERYWENYQKKTFYSHWKQIKGGKE